MADTLRAQGCDIVVCLSHMGTYGKASEDERNADTSAMLKKDADIRMNVIAGGSHMYTWSLAYNYEGIRDWLFSQSK